MITSAAWARDMVSGRPRVVHPGRPQRLVGVDVADPRHQLLVQQRPLDAGALAPRSRATASARSNSGSNGSRPMWATSAGSSAPPGESDSPPNMRWSTKRSPGPPSAKSNSTRVLGANGASASSSRNWPLIPRWASTASPSVSGSQRYLPRRRGSAKVRPTSCARSRRPRQVAADRPGMQHLALRDLPAGDAGGQTAADDLDLGKLRHAPESAGGDRPGAAAALQRREGDGRGVLLGFLLVPAGTGP